MQDLHHQQYTGTHLGIVAIVVGILNAVKYPKPKTPNKNPKP